MRALACRSPPPWDLAGSFQVGGVGAGSTIWGFIPDRLSPWTSGWCLLGTGGDLVHEASALLTLSPRFSKGRHTPPPSYLVSQSLVPPWAGGLPVSQEGWTCSRTPGLLPWTAPHPRLERPADR